MSLTGPSETSHLLQINRVKICDTFLEIYMFCCEGLEIIKLYQKVKKKKILLLRSVYVGRWVSNLVISSQWEKLQDLKLQGGISLGKLIGTRNVKAEVPPCPPPQVPNCLKDSHKPVPASLWQISPQQNGICHSALESGGTNTAQMHTKYVIQISFKECNLRPSPLSNSFYNLF